jgi:hypothetical protein
LAIRAARNCSKQNGEHLDVYNSFAAGRETSYSDQIDKDCPTQPTATDAKLSKPTNHLEARSIRGGSDTTDDEEHKTDTMPLVDVSIEEENSSEETAKEGAISK